MLASSTEASEVRDPWVTRMWRLPATVVSTTLQGALRWPNATVVSGDAVDVVARLKEESDVPLRSHGSLSLNRALMAAGLVDLVQVTLFPGTPVRPGGPDLSGCGRLRPRAGREPDARRSHPRAHLPTHPPLTCSRHSSRLERAVGASRGVRLPYDIAVTAPRVAAELTSDRRNRRSHKDRLLSRDSMVLMLVALGSRALRERGCSRRASGSSRAPRSCLCAAPSATQANG